ncbi:uncharacterized protein [Bombus fervidus]|uniref:uncharacterized protein n=1 Tax=Bombus fervidus TaxID=203811 RepID=UPI003AB870B1
MLRPIATVFILAVAVQVTFAFIDHPRETIILKLSDKDVIQTNSDSNLKPRNINTYLGTLSAGHHLQGETLYTTQIEHRNNRNNVVLALDLVLQVQGITHFVSAENINGSEAVVCETANTLGSSRSTIRVRIAPSSTARLRVLVGTH